MKKVNFYVKTIPSDNRIQIIKLIRSLTGSDLRQAKIHEAEFAQPDGATFVGVTDDPADVCTQFRALGATMAYPITDEHKMYKDSLNKIICSATLKGDYHIVRMLTSVVEKL